MYKKLIFTLLLTVFLFTLPVLAWDDAGHRLTAYIAWERMTPAAREQAIKILLKAPENSDLSVFYIAYNSRSAEAKQRDLFMTAANWGDIIRDKNFPVRFETYNQPTWHYADKYWRQNGETAIVLSEMGGTDSDGKAIKKLYDFDKILRNPTASDADKAIALAWFLHVGGDIHNPLHNASRVTDIEPEGDSGGNKFMLSPKDAPREDQMNLHSFWDQIITRNFPRKDDKCDADYIGDVAKKVTDKYSYNKLKDRLKLGDFEAWHQEGFAFLPKQVYPESLKRGEMPSKDYQENASKIGQEQLALAGYRLGDMLNNIFDGAAAATSNSSGKTTAASNTTQTNNNATANPTAQIPCKIIRKVLYPVSQVRTPDQKLKLAVLDVCPPDKGKVARPLTTIVVDGKLTYLEYDVIKVFDSEKEAKKYAEENKITDAEY